MKKLKVILLLAAVSLGFNAAAQADGLSLAFSFGGQRHHRHYEERYSAPVVRYRETRYSAPAVRDYDEDYYRPRRRVVQYYEAPVYYEERPRYYYRQSHCH